MTTLPQTTYSGPAGYPTPNYQAFQGTNMQNFPQNLPYANSSNQQFNAYPTSLLSNQYNSSNSYNVNQTKPDLMEENKNFLEKSQNFSQPDCNGIKFDGL